MTGPVPARVDAQVKDVLLGLLDHAVGQGWPVSKACQVLGLDPRRVHRWIGRHWADVGDHRPGGSVNALLEDEVDAIVEVFDTWGERDRSHRRLAHRGSYIGRFWASPSTVRRVLTLQDKHSGRSRAPPRASVARSRTGPPTDRTPSGSRTRPTSPCGMTVLHRGPGLPQVAHPPGLGRRNPHPGAERVHRRPRRRRAAGRGAGPRRQRPGRPGRR